MQPTTLHMALKGCCLNSLERSYVSLHIQSGQVRVDCVAKHILRWLRAALVDLLHKH